QVDLRIGDGTTNGNILTNQTNVWNFIDTASYDRLCGPIFIDNSGLRCVQTPGGQRFGSQSLPSNDKQTCCPGQFLWRKGLIEQIQMGRGKLEQTEIRSAAQNTDQVLNASAFRN